MPPFKRIVRHCLALGWAAYFSTASRADESFLIQDGKPRAEIVTAEKPTRMAKLAADELQEYLRKITGAQVPIATKPSGGEVVPIFVGRSIYTDQRKLSDADLTHGAFRIAVGEKWLALLGQDDDFAPRQPWAKHIGDLPRMLKDWDTLTGATWDDSVGSTLHRKLHGQTGWWEYDRRGSLNAVHEFLHTLGVRWYMPGELGEVVPKRANVALPRESRLVRPDFPLRYPHFAFYTLAEQKDDMLWYLRLGLNHGDEVIGHGVPGHGTADVHSRAEMKKAHPEYFALRGGKRDTDSYAGTECLSSEGLFKENVRYVRAMFDHHDEPMVSVMPEDGYSTACQCDLCKGKETPGRGFEGKISDYVWGYVDRVAREVYKTHPHRKISCFAYGTYTLPPEKIEKLSPNLVVGIVQPRRFFYDREKREHFVKLRQAWLEKSASKELLIWDHYPFTLPGKPYHGIPAWFPHLVAEDLRSLRGISKGEILEVMFDPQRGFGLHAPGFNHLNLYVTARFYWDANQDVEKLLDEYYALFYGPARVEMKALIEYAESNWMHLTKSPEKIGKLFELLGAAQAKAPADSAYGKRIALVADFVQPLKQLRAQLAIGRKDVPELRVNVGDAKGFRLDGKLDDKLWQGVAAYNLRELEKGKPPVSGTTVKAVWSGDSLYLGITCRDADTKTLNIGTKKNGDEGIWKGDCVEVLLETQEHSYYQIVVNPAGAKIDLDRRDGALNNRWASGAEVAAHIGDGEWTVEMRIPVIPKANLDPLNGVVGHQPNEMYPWYFNICRQRVRGKETELSAFSPTGKDNFHELLKFGKLFVR